MIFRKTVASITSSLVTMMNELDEHAVAMEAKSARHVKIAHDHMNTANQALDEIKQAKAVRENIAKIITVN